MAELDTIVLENPTKSDFSHHFNGELYTIKANETKSFTQFVGFHLAKHLATKMVSDSFTKENLNDPKKAVQISQQRVYDNPKLRIALYKILKDVSLVQRLIESYPYKEFLGNIEEYENFVKKSTAENSPTKKVGDDKKIDNLKE